MLVVLARQAVEVQRLPDMRFDPVGELGIAGGPACKPRLQVLLGFFEVAPVVEPAQLLAAVVVSLAGQIVERIAEEVNVAALLDRFREELSDGPFDPRVIVGDDELHAVQPARLEAFDEGRPA